MSDNTEQAQKGVTEEMAIFDLLFKNQVFAKCPKCKKYMSLFEVYNSNCSCCGKVNSGHITIISI